MTEFGNLALIDQDAGEENGVAIPLPGVRKGEQKSPTHCLRGTAAPAVWLQWGSPPVSTSEHFSGTWNP